MRLTPSTDEIPFVNLYLTFYGSDRVPFGAKTSRYGPHELGCYVLWDNTIMAKTIKLRGHPKAYDTKL